MATYSMREDGFQFKQIEADSAEEPLDAVDVSNGDYDTSDGTVWTEIYAQLETCDHAHVTDDTCDECEAACTHAQEQDGVCFDNDCPLHGAAEDDSTSRTFTIEPKEPPCPGEKAHDWESPYVILGGLEENPGVWGHGGGVIIKEVCMCCGCLKTTDTWAQNPSNGVQGLTSVAYSPREYRDEVRDLAEAKSA